MIATLHETEFSPIKGWVGSRKPPTNLMSSGKVISKSEKAVGISVASRITGIEIHTLRYWETEFSDYLQPLRTAGGQRRYRPEDIQAVYMIKRLLRDEMFSIPGARRHLAKQAEWAA